MRWEAAVADLQDISGCSVKAAVYCRLWSVVTGTKPRHRGKLVVYGGGERLEQTGLGY